MSLPPAAAVRPVRAADAPALAEFFARSDVPCHCRYFHFPGDTNAWLTRLAHDPDRNRDDFQGALACGTPESSGIVALRGAEVVGWLKVAPVRAVPKIYAQRVYRGLPCFDGSREGVHAIGCVLVDPSWRGRGVARALLGGAIDDARAAGARALEAFPRRGDGLRPDEVFTGPFRLFAQRGFSVVHDFAPYPVLRLVL